jgi:hypothetical protein
LAIFVVDCRKTGDRLRKSGKLRILKILIGKSGRMVEIRKILPESGKLAGMIKHSMHNFSEKNYYGGVLVVEVVISKIIC